MEVDSNFAVLAQDLRSIALLNPRLALMLARGQPLQPRAYNITLRWDAITAEVPFPTQLSERLYQDCWLSDLIYSVEAPLIAPGSVWQPFIEESYNKTAGRFIYLDLEVQGPDRYRITNERTPMASICSDGAMHKGTLLDRAWTLSHDQNLYVTGTNHRAFTAAQVPTIVTLTLCVRELSGCNLRSIGYDEAVCALRKMGLYPDQIVDAEKKR